VNEPSPRNADEAPVAVASDLRLQLARRIEHTTALARQVRSRLQDGAWPRRRKRARRQLKKLVRALAWLQRASLARPAGGVDLQALDDALVAAEGILRDALYHDASRDSLTHLRRTLRERRRILRALARGGDHA
jgi:hypothetical protein